MHGAQNACAFLCFNEMFYLLCLRVCDERVLVN